MADDPQEPHYNEEQVTGGRQEHVVRWVLGISLILVTIALSAIWIIASVAK